MKTTGTRSNILVEYDHRSIKISGELTTTPAFYADSNSIKKWEMPYENLEITEQERKEIIARIIEHSKNLEFKLFFE